MTAYGGNLTGLPSEHPLVQEALSRVWRAPRALRLADDSFALFTYEGALLSVGLMPDELVQQVRLYVAAEPRQTHRLPLRNAQRYTSRGEPEINLEELGL